jgi:hypothetical protein
MRLSNYVLSSATGAQVRARVGEDRFFDVGFRDLVKDPLAVVRSIRKKFDLPTPPGTDDLVQRYLETDRGDSRGSHVYSVEQWGINADEVRRDFADYINRFSIHLEKVK